MKRNLSYPSNTHLTPGESIIFTSALQGPGSGAQQSVSVTTNSDNQLTGIFRYRPADPCAFMEF